MPRAGVAIVALLMVPSLLARQGAIAGLTTTEARLILAVDRMLYDRWYPPESIPPPPEHPDDRGLFTAALQSGDVTLRALAIRLAGRFENPIDAHQLAQSLTDRDPTIRAAAALSVAQVLCWLPAIRRDGLDQDSAAPRVAHRADGPETSGG